MTQRAATGLVLVLLVGLITHCASQVRTRVRFWVLPQQQVTHCAADYKSFKPPGLEPVHDLQGADGCLDRVKFAKLFQDRRDVDSLFCTLDVKGTGKVTYEDFDRFLNG